MQVLIASIRKVVEEIQKSERLIKQSEEQARRKSRGCR